MRLTPHFNLDELTHSNTAVRLNIDNTPLPEEIEKLKYLAEKLEDVRMVLDHNSILISSGFRCLELNRVLKSKDTSHHIICRAVDFTCPNFGDVNQIMKKLRDTNIQFEQCLLEYNSWIHLSFPEKGKKPKRQMLRIGRSGVTIYE